MSNRHDAEVIMMESLSFPGGGVVYDQPCLTRALLCLSL